MAASDQAELTEAVSSTHDTDTQASMAVDALVTHASDNLPQPVREALPCLRRALVTHVYDTACAAASGASDPARLTRAASSTHGKDPLVSATSAGRAAHEHRAFVDSSGLFHVSARHQGRQSVSG